MRDFMRLARYIKPYTKWIVIAGLSLLAMTAANLAAPYLITNLTRLLSGGVTQEDTARIIQLALLLTGAYALRAVFRFLNQYCAHVAAWHMVGDVRVKAYDHMQNLSLRYFSDKQTGNLMARLLGDIDQLETLTAHVLPEIITNVLLIIGVSVVLFVMQPVLTLLSLVPVPLIVVSGWLFVSKVLPHFRRSRETFAELSGAVQENLSGIREIHAFQTQKREKKRVKKLQQTNIMYLLKALRLSALFHPATEFFTSLGTVIVVGFGGVLAINGQLDVPEIVGFILYLSLFYTPIAALARVSEDFSQASVAARRALEVLDQEPDVREKPDAVALPPVKGHLVLDHVTFGYEAGASVLENVTMDIQPGQMVALVGPTGVGKTTILGLMARFYDPCEGRVLLDGQDLKNVTFASLRGQMSMVLQDVFLFHGTVADNIAYGKPDATREEIISAAQMAAIHDFVQTLPQGYDTLVGERGVKLSGGQKQRLSIARALLRDTPLLFLDEATSSVDTETEEEIQQAIADLIGTRTLVVIAHRLSTVVRADCIYVLADGRVCQQGTHAQLLEEKDGIYARLCANQFVNRG